MHLLNQILSITKRPGRVINHLSFLLTCLLMTLPIMLAGCSGGDVTGAVTGGTSGSTSGGTDNNSSGGYSIFLARSQPSILTNNNDTALITATLIKDNVAQPDETITFSANDGLLISNSAITDASGDAAVTIKSGPRANNQVITVKASSNGATASIPLEINGNTLALKLDQANMAQGSSQQLTTTLQNAVPSGISGATVTYNIVSGTNVVSLSKSTDTTDVFGKSKINVTGNNPGTAIIMATSLGTTAQIEIIVSGPADVFEITSPTNNPTTLSTDDSLDITVNVPPPTTSVTFNTSIGTWQNGLASITVDGSSGTATATLSSTDTGLATIDVTDHDNSSINDTLEVNIFAPASQANSINLDASQYNMPTSSSVTTKNSVTLTATVRTAPTPSQPSGGVVGNAQIAYTLQYQPGGGEQVTPGLATTNSNGTATSNFYSGSLASGASGVKITATVVGTNVTDSVYIVITDQPGSVVIGLSTKLLSSSDDTYYTQKITTQVADSNGNAVVNQRIYLQLWPTYYFYGYWAKDAQGKCTVYDTPWPDGDCSNPYFELNEDTNMSLGLDAGEDTGPMGTPDGFLTPPNSAAGTIPAYVTTDEFGLATFDMTYLKVYASWIYVALKASTSAQMTENTTVYNWRLGVTTLDASLCEDGGVFNSPFGYAASCNGPVATP